MASTKPPQRKHVVMWARLEWYGLKRHEVTITLVSDSNGLYTLYVSGRNQESVSSIRAAQCWFVSKVKDIMIGLDALIIAGGVYYGGR